VTVAPDLTHLEAVACGHLAGTGAAVTSRYADQAGGGSAVPRDLFVARSITGQRLVVCGGASL